MYSENKYLLLISVGPKIASFRPCRRNAADPPQPEAKPLCRIASHHRRASSEQQRSKVGFPIRKFSDQSLFAAPQDLSQRTTSFIASQRQGIHQIPLRHLIVLITKERAPRSISRSPRMRPSVKPKERSAAPPRSKRPVLLQTHPGALRSSEAHD